MFDDMNLQLKKIHPKGGFPPPPCGTFEVCTGCGACAACCPQGGLAMRPDSEGFFYPFTDAHLCNDCGLCGKICPVNPRQTFSDHNASERQGTGPFSIFAAWHLDETIRRESSSGGVFTALADSVLARGGAVVGAVFDEHFAVRHILIEAAADLPRLRGSKYVQSEIPRDLYWQVRDRLKQGQPVLFTGTPCQVAGLRSYLREFHEHLFCCDVVCMGVPASFLFSKYIDWECGGDDAALVSCEFRNKTRGWKRPSVRLHFASRKDVIEYGARNPYSRAFGKRIALRPSCYACQFKGTERPGDLTIGDFWGVAKKYPEYDRDDKGTSLVLVNSKKGKALLDACRSSLFTGPADLDTAIVENTMLVRPCPRPPERENFYHDLKNLPFDAMIRKYQLRGPTMLERLSKYSKRKLKSAVRWLFCQVESDGVK